MNPSYRLPTYKAAPAVCAVSTKRFVLTRTNCFVLTYVVACPAAKKQILWRPENEHLRY